ncbi:hypothetical protein [uncultured Jannaschia sp.]|uniref:hypothetical protein n=1 Tax=uncultured Jannaschia sp. TaxID=293347 RepID=UPI00262E0D17|nr:hypothetical protein [uncultured Jannaschia sp.]
MENFNHLLVVFTAYVFAAGSPDPSTLRIMGVAARDRRRAGRLFGFAGLRLLLSRV